MNAKPELIGGRSPSATLTSFGKRQARALGVHLRSAGMEFDAVYSSPLERAVQTAYAVCQVMRHCQNPISKKISSFSLLLSWSFDIYHFYIEMLIEN
jgi:broad specificity phosphatase PhoE